MEEQIILAVDDNGKFSGEYIKRSVGHTGEGKRHLAVTVLIYNKRGQVLLQRRKHKLFDNIWDFTASTHPLHLEDGSDETLDEATRRCLKTEWGTTEIGEIRVMGEFNYFAKVGELCENEHCAMMVGEYDGEVNLNPKVGYEYKWVDKKEFLQDIEVNPQNYTPWAQKAVKLLKQMFLG